MGLIHEAIVKIKQDVGAVSKDGFNAQQKFKFRSIDGIYNAVHSIFAKHGVFTVPRVISQTFDRYETKSGSSMKSVQLLVEYDLVAGDGSSVRFGPIAGEGSDAGDKATSKALAMAHKYLLIQALQLETEDGDPDADTAPARASSRDREPERGRPAAPEDQPAAQQDLSKVRGKLADSLREWTAGDKVKAKDIIGFILPGQSSVSQLADALVRRYSLGWWLYRLVGGKPDAVREFLALPGLPWFDKMTDQELDKLKQYCKEEDARQSNAAAGHKTMSPDIKDQNGNDPF
jgi:hypothetical protein